MKSTWDLRTCGGCGTTLEPGETCNCQRPAKCLPRDGLRAYCPYFQHRSSYRGRYYIVCGGRKTPYPDSEQRDRHYRRYCCGLYGLCELCQTMKGGHQSNA